MFDPSINRLPQLRYLNAAPPQQRRPTAPARITAAAVRRHAR
jgi:hypothetical protein